MAKLKVVLWGVVAALVVLAVGWLWGASGRWDAEASNRDAQLRLRIADARGALALARVDLFELNYGQASRHLQLARDALADASSRFDAAGQKAAGDGVRQALARTGEAQQLAASVNTAANERAAEALKALDHATGLPPAK